MSTPMRRQVLLRRWAITLWVVSGVIFVAWVALLLTIQPEGLGLLAAAGTVAFLIGFSLWRISDAAYGVPRGAKHVDADNPPATEP